MSIIEDPNNSGLKLMIGFAIVIAAVAIFQLVTGWTPF